MRLPHPSSRWARRLFLAGALVAVALVAGFLWLRNDPENPVGLDEVTERYNSDGSAMTPSGAVDPGVYVYATSGSERVDALGGATHTYPDRTTVTVRYDSDGCVSTRWDALEQRWDERTVCPARGGGWRLRTVTLHHSFFRRGETRRYGCARDAVEVPARLEPGTTFTAACESTGSGHSGRSREHIVGEVVGIEDVEVDGTDVEAARIRYTTSVDGETQGGGTVDRWYAVDALPLLVREVSETRTRSQTVIGTVTHTETFELVLTDRRPRT